MVHLFDGISAQVRPWLVVSACLIVAGAVAAVWLMEVPIGSVLLALLVLACPLSHLLLGHGGHNHSQTMQTQDTGARTSLTSTEK